MKVLEAFRGAGGFRRAALFVIRGRTGSERVNDSSAKQSRIEESRLRRKRLT